MNKTVIPFAGYPILLLEAGFNLNNNELNSLIDLEYADHVSIKNLKISTDVDILRLDEFKRLKHFIKESLDSYVSDILQIKNTFSFCQSWSAIQNKDAYHPCHAHYNHIISSVYYAKAEETKLIFHVEKSKIQDGYYFDYDVKEYNWYNSSSYTVSLKTGDIIFFPGQLKHESSINNNNERIIVGSSFFIDGKIGKKTLITDLDIINNKNIIYT